MVFLICAKVYIFIHKLFYNMPSKFKQLLDTIGSKEVNEFTKAISKPKSYNHVKDNIPLVADSNFQADLLFLPTAQFGFKYGLILVDLATDLFDIEPIKNKDSDTVLKALKKIDSRGIIDTSKAFTLQTDAGSEFQGMFGKYLKDAGIYHKVALPNRHTCANVESLNRQLGRLFTAYMNKKEEKNKKQFSNWTEIVPTIRLELNKLREKKLPKDINSYKYATPDDTKEVTTIVKKDKTEKEVKILEDIKPKFKIGQYVYRYLDSPENTLGKKQSGKKREGDILWDREPREIEKIFTYAGDGPLYRYYLDGLPNVSFTEAQIKRAPNPN